MFLIISPAKRLDFASALPEIQVKLPVFLTEAEYLAAQLQRFSLQQLAQLMHLSDKLAKLNYQRFQDWQLSAHQVNPHHALSSARPALFAFKGDVYQGIAVSQLTKEDLAFAEQHLFILSGLYGVLRTQDAILPYRLEMGCGLVTDKASDLYTFWQPWLTDYFTKILLQEPLPEQRVLVNLASQEYAAALDFAKLPALTITPVFKERKQGTYKIVGLSAKKARGLMARFIIQRRMNKVADIKAFNWAGYIYNESLSEQNHWVFTRG